MENYIQVKVLGKGSFGAAWLVQRRRDNANFVAKEVRISAMKREEKESAMHEIAMLRKLDHPNITRYVDHFEHRGSLFIVMEYANGGDLYTKIQSRKGVRLQEKEVLHYFVQLCLALMHMHDQHVLHRDLKTQNVFLTADGVVKLGDFGISTVLRNTFELKRTVCGTPYYFSPELCLNKPYNNKSDVWALGCILYELTTLTHAFDGTSMKALVQKILRGVYPPIHSSYSRDLATLIGAMLNIDPAKRPNIHQILGCEYIKAAIVGMRGNIDAANREKRSCVDPEDKARAVRDAEERLARDEAARKEKEQREKERCAREHRDAQARAAEREQEQQRRLGEMRKQMEREMKAHEEKLARVREQQQVEAQRRKELEERAKKRAEEDRRARAQRDAAQQGLFRKREEEWDRNVREQMAKMQQQQQQQPQHPQYQPQQQQNQVYHQRQQYQQQPPSPTPQEQQQQAAYDAAMMFREARREAQANKMRAAAIANGGDVPMPAPALAAASPLPRQQQQQQQPSPQQPQPQPQQQQGGGVRKAEQMTAEELDKARREAYWQMRREAEANKRRLQGLDPLPPPAAEGPTPTPAPAPALRGRDEERPLPARGAALAAAPSSGPSPQRPPSQPEAPPAPLLNRRHSSPALAAAAAAAPAPPPVPPAVPPPMPQRRPVSPDVSSDSDDDDAGLHRFLNGEACAGRPSGGNAPAPAAAAAAAAAAPAAPGVDDERRRVADYGELGAQLALALSLDHDACGDADFDDPASAAVASDPSKFMLGGQTLQLPNCRESDPLGSRIESLRIFLEASLGCDTFLRVYRLLESDGDDDAGDVEASLSRARALLVPAQYKYIDVVTQLIFCENAFNQRQFAV